MLKGIGIGRFCPGKMGFKPLGLGFGHWEWEKMLKSKMGMGFENCEMGFRKKMNWEMGLVPPSRTLWKDRYWKELHVAV